MAKLAEYYDSANGAKHEFDMAQAKKYLDNIEEGVYWKKQKEEEQ